MARKKIYILYPGADTTDERYYIAMLIVAALAMILVALNTRRVLEKATKMALIPLAAGSGVQILSYTATAYGGAKEWYWISQMILVTLVGSLLIELVIRPLQKLKFARATLEASSIMLGIFLPMNSELALQPSCATTTSPRPTIRGSSGVSRTKHPAWKHHRHDGRRECRLLHS